MHSDEFIKNMMAINSYPVLITRRKLDAIYNNLMKQNLSTSQKRTASDTYGWKITGEEQ